MAFIDLVKAKVSAIVEALAVTNPTEFDPLTVALGDEGTGPTYNTVIIDDAELMLGQAWSGPANDPEAPADGPQAAMVNKGMIAQVVQGIAAGFAAAVGVFSGSTGVTAAAVVQWTSTSVDSDAYSYASGQFTCIHAGDYDVDFNVWGDGATDDTVVRVWLELAGSEVDGTRASIAIPTTAAAGITEGGCAVSRRLVGITASQVVRVKIQKTVGSAFNLRRGSFRLRMAK